MPLAASAIGTCWGIAPRASSVNTFTSGMTTTSARPSGGCMRRARGPGTRAVMPPSRQAAALSPCPSNSIARARMSLGDQRRCPRALAATRPAHTAAADDPRPRPNGMRLWQVISRPSRLSMPLASALQKRLSAFSGTSPAPWPVTCTTSGPSRRTMSTSFDRSMASASTSKPGPRLADVAGATMVSTS